MRLSHALALHMKSVADVQVPCDPIYAPDPVGKAQHKSAYARGSLPEPEPNLVSQYMSVCVE